jgi:hypothetical protein
MNNQAATQPRKQIHGAGIVYAVVWGLVAWIVFARAAWIVIAGVADALRGCL